MYYTRFRTVHKVFRKLLQTVTMYTFVFRLDGKQKYYRSGQGKKQIILLNSVGVIDSDYRGNIKILLKNISDNKHKIEVGDRIAQLVIIPIILCDFVDSWNDTERGTGGFGSTGQ